MTLKESVTIFISCLVFLCDSTAVYNCSSEDPVPKSVNISNCSGPRCVIQSGTNVSIEQIIVPNHEIEELKSLAIAFSPGSDPIVYGIEEKTACDRMYYENGTKASCPLKNGTPYVFKAVFEWLSLGGMFLEWVLHEGELETVTCFFIGVEDKLYWT